jgi:hypothetical protein
MKGRDVGEVCRMYLREQKCIINLSETLKGSAILEDIIDVKIILK